MSEKPFRSYSEQIEILKSRGLKFVQNGTPLKTLMEENYYNVINGYKTQFLDKNSDNEKFIHNAQFSEIVALYRFDKEIRYIFLKELLKIENKLRSLISYTFSERYGHMNYLKFENFEDLKTSGASQKNIEKRAAHIHELIARMQRDLANAIDKKEYIKHYMNKYGYVPFWVLVNSVTFGSLGKFYGLMKPQDQNIVAKYFMIKDDSLKQYINIMASFRNLCAHDERLYNVRLNKAYIMPKTEWHEKLNIEKNDNGKYCYGSNDLFSLVIIFRIMLPRNEFESFYYQLSKKVKLLSNNIISIKMDEIYVVMGFPSNWREIKKSLRPA